MLPAGVKRHEWKGSHGYRKAFKSRAEQVMRPANVHNQWLVTLDLNKTVRGEIKYKVPDRSTFYKFAGRLGKDKMLEIVIQLINLGIIKGEKVSLDCSIIWAWFKDCRWSNNPRHDKKECRGNRGRDRDASWTWDNHRERYVYGYKVHVVIDSNSGTSSNAPYISC